MKIVIYCLLASFAAAFVPLQLKHETLTLMEMGYVPDGMSREEYMKLRNKEKDADSKKNFGAFGPQSFKSRSLQSFQKDLESGKAGHLLPVFNAKEKVKRGELKREDVPYMQRGGSWDNSDVKSAKKKQWTADDRRYEANNAPAKLDWMGRAQRTGPSAGTQKQQQQPKTKKLFGLF